MVSTSVNVYRASGPEEAAIVAAWLSSQGIEARVPASGNFGVMAFGLTDDQGISVQVLDPNEAAKARALLEEHHRSRRSRVEDSSGAPIVEVTCRRCARLNRFRLDQRGTVGECPHCGEYLDIPIRN
jgi:RNase P subunit RPR2